MHATQYTDITPLDPEWFWQGRIPQNETTILAGDGGIGKGRLLANLVARTTRGLPMPDGTPGPPLGSVILATYEDDPNLAMSHRLIAEGADLTRVWDMTSDFQVPESLPSVREAIADIGDVRLVVIDPLSAVASIPLTSSNVRVRRVLMAPLERLARDTGIALVVVHHTVKSGRVAGTKGITDAARMVLRVTRATADERIRLIQVDKCNIADDMTGDVAYTIAGTFPDVRVAWLSAPPEATEGTEAASRPPTTAELVLSALRGSQRPLEGQELAKITGQPYGAVRVALTRLKSGGEVVSPARKLWTVAPGLDAVRVAQLEVENKIDREVIRIST